jgi:hypothetical protein
MIPPNLRRRFSRIVNLRPLMIMLLGLFSLLKEGAREYNVASSLNFI